MPESHREKRRRRRVRTRRTAWIDVGGDSTPVRCVLWDLSEGGARLAPAQASKLPDIFTLILDKTTAHRCSVVWRKGPLVGVRFLFSAEDEQAAAAKPAAAEPRRELSPELSRSLAMHGSGDAALAAGPSVSFFAAGFVLLLLGLTALFYFAGQQSELGSPWALNVCHEADSLCRHPEFPGGASVLMALVYFAARGMEL
jgi:PilZ domain